MPAPAYMLSLLVRQYLLLRDAFHSRRPSSWLIWEPGAWRAARSPLQGDSAVTHQPDTRAAQSPVGSDALCFELESKAGAVELSVGRSSASDIYINDMTLSREHLKLSLGEGQWAVSVLPAAHTITTIDDVPAQGDQRYPLHPGTRLLAGDVQLTYYDVRGFLDRLKGEAERLAT